MVFNLPESISKAPAAEPTGLDAMSPRQIVAELDRHVIGQADAKRAVAIALRNRIRRQRLLEAQPDLADDVMPKNIIMIGPTGVGKTEIARRLSRMTSSPFVKVEASKFTEVGYVGRDVESIIRDLTEMAVELVRREKSAQVRDRACKNAEEQLLDLLLPAPPSVPSVPASASKPEGAPPGDPSQDRASHLRTREKLRDRLRAGAMEESVVEVEVSGGGPSPTFKIWTGQGMEEMNINLRDSLPGLFGGAGRSRKRKMTVAEARELLQKEEEAKLVDLDQVGAEAVDRVEQSGIVFLDEIDKIAAGAASSQGPDVSREGVQRDLLPIVEGTLVNTKYGQVRTDHILFIASGAFHVSRPSDLIPELQGRFPIRVELSSLDKQDLIRILKEPRSALTRQYRSLMETEDVHLSFTDDGIEAIAGYAAAVNQSSENIGARRLHTIMELLLEEILFEGAEMADRNQVIDRAYVEEKLKDVVEDHDLSRSIL